MKNKVFRKYIIYAVFFLLFFSCKQTNKEYSRIEFILGTVCSVRIYSPDGKAHAEKVLNKVFKEFYYLDSVFNANAEYSALEKVNKNAGKKPIEVPAELYLLVKKSLYFVDLSGGAFNPAIGPLVKLWGIGGESARVPSKSEIEKVLAQCDYKDIELLDGSIFLKKDGMRLDLGGIAKGFAADRAVEILKEEGILHAVIDLGGNVFVFGCKPDGSLWHVGIKDPVINGDKQPAALIKTSNKTVVTSGNYERFFIKDGKVYHHILDSKSGEPVENSLSAVTIAADSSLIADALSTSCYVLGFEKSLELLQHFPNCGAIFFFKDKHVFITENIKSNVELLKPSM